MRGNETGEDPPRVIEFPQQFPIPMRGNEARGIAPRHGLTEAFPIPMRGNMPVSGAFGSMPIATWMFPIPF